MPSTRCGYALLGTLFLAVSPELLHAGLVDSYDGSFALNIPEYWQALPKSIRKEVSTEPPMVLAIVPLSYSASDPPPLIIMSFAKEANTKDVHSIAIRERQIMKDKSSPTASVSGLRSEVLLGQLAYIFERHRDLHRETFIFFSWDGRTYEAAISGNSTSEARTALNSIQAATGTQTQTIRMRLSYSILELPPGWLVVRNDDHAFSLARVRGNSKDATLTMGRPLGAEYGGLILALAGKRKLEQELIQVAQAYKPLLTSAPMQTVSIPRSMQKEATLSFITGTSGSAGQVLTGVISVDGQTFFIAAESKTAPPREFVLRLLSSFYPDPAHYDQLKR
jgi:hypothetical protein